MGFELRLSDGESDGKKNSAFADGFGCADSVDFSDFSDCTAFWSGVPARRDQLSVVGIKT
jgi:hypothetical protein